MQIKIIQINEIEQAQAFVGGKTFNLKKCIDWGFDVPKFVALPAYISRDLYENENFRQEIADDICQKLAAKTYAVRSSALIEDGAEQSFAGQFLTKLDVSKDKLSMAILEVLEHANSFLDGNLDKFSFIIQEYIVPDVAGVVFTRNPNGGREMVMEYGFCEGEKIVSGSVKPEKLNFYWGQDSVNLEKNILKTDIVSKCKSLEGKYGFPQDIEWCIKGDQFYILQTRPITTISKNQYEGIIFLENELASKEKYFFEKTELSEISPRPARMALDLLKMIYGQDGPVSRVYKHHGVSYFDTDFIYIIGNELFVDKEKEIKGLLPSYSYLGNNEFLPKFSHFSGIFTTIKNLFSLNTIKTGGHGRLFSDLKIRLESADVKGEFNSLWEKFLKDYELIFEVNLLSGLAVKKLDFLLKKETVKFIDILNESDLFVDGNNYQVERQGYFSGNSLDLFDESVFVSDNENPMSPDGKVETWWNSLPQYKKNLFSPKIVEAIVYNRLRELGRWLTVKNISSLRNCLLSLAGTNGFSDPRNIYFASINEVLDGQVNQTVCQKRKEEYLSFNKFIFPVYLTSSLLIKNKNIFGVSPGLANGVMQNREYLDSNINQGVKVILYTEILSPDLTKYFNQISGIVSNNGGLLSHLAIVARENHIPVVVGLSLTEDDFKIGDSIQIDGSSGTIIKI